MVHSDIDNLDVVNMVVGCNRFISDCLHGAVENVYSIVQVVHVSQNDCYFYT